MATTTTGAAYRNAVRPSWLSEPLPQANRLVVFWLNRMSSVAVADCRARATAEPASRMRVVDVPAPDNPSTSTAAVSPPRNATPPEAQSGMVSPNAATATTARYDPAVTARVSGEANEFRVSDCNNAPAIPSAQPDGDPRSQPRNPRTDQDLPGGFSRWHRSLR